MSTNYVLLDNAKGSVECLEHSNKFDLELGVGSVEPHYLSLDNLTLEELKEINQQLTNLISYFDPDYRECKVD
ncbi:hypothetical protein NVP1187O_212 [Vibrio phage 1.187.O._10N.286.49.F1]|nr:hypothetical protein NVP1187O_212 [Vibrio phage 1.187.O._10N.286.49.F1]